MQLLSHSYTLLAPDLLIQRASPYFLVYSYLSSLFLSILLVSVVPPKLGMTEPAWTSPWNYQKTQGTFTCAYCGQDLFDSNGKYDSGSGWPSFWRTKGDGSVVLKREWGGRVECQCSKCKGHLGHVFMDGPYKTTMDEDLVQSIPEGDLKSPTNPSRLPRYCINGASLRFEGKNDS